VTYFSENEFVVQYGKSQGRSLEDAGRMVWAYPNPAVGIWVRKLEV
jgi:hypothetical protein